MGTLGLLIGRTRGGLAALALALALAAVSPAAAGEPPPGHIRFEASNLVSTARGEFRDWRITRAEVDEDAPERSRVELEVAIASLDTSNPSRDEHLRSPDFFDVEKFPTARVTLEGFRMDGPDAFSADVSLEIRDRKKTFPMQFRIADRATRRIEGAVTLDRRDFGVGQPYSRWTLLSVHDEVLVKVEAVVPPATARAAP